jgi:hypothetical protein
VATKTPDPTRTRKPDSLDALVDARIEARFAAIAELATSQWMRRNNSPLPDKIVDARIADGTFTASRPPGSKFTYIRRDQHDAYLAAHAVSAAAANDDDAERDAVLARIGLEPIRRRR